MHDILAVVDFSSSETLFVNYGWINIVLSEPEKYMTSADNGRYRFS